jgi:glycerol-3-phosphate dehydrogenase
MTEDYDIVIIGGGIHGAGVAQAAAARGFSTLVLEQNTLASATSSRSSKLVHGGLRYLETAQFSLVRECLGERALLLKLAPELVKLQPFYIPVYRSSQRRPWLLRTGLAIYSILAGLGKEARFNTVPRKLWDSLDGLDLTDLETVYQYHDAQTDDAALTKAVMYSAQMLGAKLAMPALFTSAQLNENRCIVHYQVSGDDYICESGAIVNAAGPWVNNVLDKIIPAPKKLTVELVQGTHIIIAGTLSHGIYYLESPWDHRAVFAMPWKHSIMIGTTESHYEGDPAAVKPLPTEEEYLLNTFRHYFPASKSLQRQDIVASFAGLRVLPASDESPFLRSRDTTLYPDRLVRPRLINIYGGKLTTYRATAEKVINQLLPGLPHRKPVADTKTLVINPVSGAYDSLSY